MPPPTPDQKIDFGDEAVTERTRRVSGCQGKVFLFVGVVVVVLATLIVVLMQSGKDPERFNMQCERSFCLDDATEAILLQQQAAHLDIVDNHQFRVKASREAADEIKAKFRKKYVAGPTTSRKLIAFGGGDARTAKDGRTSEIQASCI